MTSAERRDTRGCGRPPQLNPSYPVALLNLARYAGDGCGAQRQQAHREHVIFLRLESGDRTPRFFEFGSGVGPTTAVYRQHAARGTGGLHSLLFLYAESPPCYWLRPPSTDGTAGPRRDTSGRHPGPRTSVLCAAAWKDTHGKSSWRCFGTRSYGCTDLTQ